MSIAIVSEFDLG